MYAIPLEIRNTREHICTCTLLRVCFGWSTWCLNIRGVLQSTLGTDMWKNENADFVQICILQISYFMKPTRGEAFWFWFICCIWVYSSTIQSHNNSWKCYRLHFVFKRVKLPDLGGPIAHLSYFPFMAVCQYSLYHTMPFITFTD